jgi:hypothetical protein
MPEGETMKLSKLFKAGGTGVIATVSAKGIVNAVIYSSHDVVDEETVAWGMTDRRTFNNVRENPRAGFLYRNPGGGYSGARLTLELKDIESSGEMLEKVRARTARAVREQAAAFVRHVGYFKVVEIRSLI